MTISSAIAVTQSAFIVALHPQCLMWSTAAEFHLASSRTFWRAFYNSRKEIESLLSIDGMTRLCKAPYVDILCGGMGKDNVHIRFTGINDIMPLFVVVSFVDGAIYGGDWVLAMSFSIC